MKELVSPKACVMKLVEMARFDDPDDAGLNVHINQRVLMLFHHSSSS